MYEHIILLGKAHDVAIDDNFEREGLATGFELYLDENSSYKTLDFERQIIIKAAFIEEDSCLSLDEIQNIFNSIDTTKNLKTEYQMYISAVIAKRQGNTRYSVMEATTATELCVTNKIVEKCSELGIDGKGLCDSFYRSLGNRFDLLKYLGIEMATKDPSAEIVKPRNQLFHNKKLVSTNEECSKVLSAAKQYLDRYMPSLYEEM